MGYYEKFRGLPCRMTSYTKQHEQQYHDTYQYTRTTTNIDRSAICDNNQFADTHKVQFGCEVLYDGKTAEQIKLENELRFGTSGTIEYKSQVLTDYMDFMNEYGNRQATTDDKKVEEEIALPISNEWKENNNFYQNHLEE